MVPPLQGIAKIRFVLLCGIFFSIIFIRSLSTFYFTVQKRLNEDWKLGPYNLALTQITRLYEVLRDTSVPPVSLDCHVTTWSIMHASKITYWTLPACLDVLQVRWLGKWKTTIFDIFEASVFPFVVCLRFSPIMRKWSIGLARVQLKCCMGLLYRLKAPAQGPCHYYFDHLTLEFFLLHS